MKILKLLICMIILFGLTSCNMNNVREVNSLIVDKKYNRGLTKNALWLIALEETGAVAYIEVKLEQYLIYNIGDTIRIRTEQDNMCRGTGNCNWKIVIN